MLYCGHSCSIENGPPLPSLLTASTNDSPFRVQVVQSCSKKYVLLSSVSRKKGSLKIGSGSLSIDDKC